MNRGIFSFCAEGVVGILSLAIVPDVLISGALFRVLNLILGTVVVWTISGLLFLRRGRRNAYTVLRFHQISAACFFLGTNLIRFVFAAR